MKNANEILVIDARTRGLNSFVASATIGHKPERYNVRLPLVLRRAVDLGPLGDLVQSAFAADMPILVVGKYRARTSAGFTDVVGESAGRPAEVVGYLDPETKGLRRWARPDKAVLLRPSLIRAVPGAGSSNGATAAAASLGAEMLCKMQPGRVACLLEGQSDWTRVWSFTVSTEEWPEFHLEHQPGFGEFDILQRRIYRAATPKNTAIEERAGYVLAHILLTRAFDATPSSPEAFASWQQEYKNLCHDSASWDRDYLAVIEAEAIAEGWTAEADPAFGGAVIARKGDVTVRGSVMFESREAQACFNARLRFHLDLPVEPAVPEGAATEDAAVAAFFETPNS